jgi:flagellar motor switch protein FliG
MISNVDDISDLTFHEKQKAKSAIGLLRSLFIQNLGSLIDDEHPETLHLGLDDG